MTGKPNSRLKLSVITSSNEYLTISDLLAELWALRVYAIDFYPRGFDVEKALCISRSVLEKKPLLKRFGDNEEEDEGESFVNALVRYVQAQKETAAEVVQRTYGVQVPPDTFRIPALATFFPEISSFDDDRAHMAGMALVRALKLAAALNAGVVEFVLGRTVERCHRQPVGYEKSPLRCDYIHMGTPEDRIRQVVAILKDVVVKHMPNLLEKGHVKLAAEIEPGHSFILNSHKNVDFFLTELSDKGIINGVGLNLDIGHALILSESGEGDGATRITPDTVQLWWNHILHAHISDNIGYHFRDIVPGQYHYLMETSGEPGFRKWLELCARCSAQSSGFTGYLAVELEACSRIQWIQRSLSWLGKAIRDMPADQQEPVISCVQPKKG